MKIRRLKLYIFLLIILIIAFNQNVAACKEFASRESAPIEYNTENILKILEPSKKSGIFFAYDGHYVCYESEGPADFCYHFEKTLFVDEDQVAYDNAVQALLEKYGGQATSYFAHMRPDIVDPCWAQIESQQNTPVEVYERACFSDNEPEWREAINIMGCKFKIHLQVKPEYMIFFLNVFFRLLYNDSRLHNIKIFKIVEPKSFPKVISQNFPTVVIYLPIFCEINPVKRSAVLDSFIDAINECYAEMISKIAWTQTAPRFNYKINDLAYISGSEGYLKIEVKNTIERQKSDCPETKKLAARVFEIFTSDFKFVKGFEYIPKDWR